MKKVFTLFIGIFIVQSAMSQLQPQLENADAQPNCTMIQNTSFLNREANGNNTPGYRIEYGGGYVTEYLENGKYYVKTKIEFVSACEYTSRVVEAARAIFRACSMHLYFFVLAD